MTHRLTVTLPLPDDHLPFGSKEALAKDGTRFFMHTATWREDAMFKDKPQPQWYFRCTAAEDGLTRDEFLRRPVMRGEECILTFSDNRARRAIAQQLEASYPSPLGPYLLTKVEAGNSPMGFAWVFARASADGLGDTNALFPDLQRAIALPPVLRHLAAPKGVQEKGASARPKGEADEDDLPGTIKAEDDHLPF